MLSWSPARRTSAVAITLVVAAGLLAPSSAQAAGTDVTTSPVAPTDAAAATPAPDAEVTSTPVPGVVGVAEASGSASSDLVAELPKTSTSDFRMVGVTWTAGPTTGVQVEVRTRTAGTWSSWTPLGLEVQDGEGGRPGTEPLWVGDADGVAARVTSTGGALQGVRIDTIDPGSDDAGTGTGTTSAASTTVASSPSAATAAFSTSSLGTAASRTTSLGTASLGAAATAADGAPSYTPQPAIISRSAWGAEPGTPCDTPAAGDRTRGVVVHHTAGTNSYTADQSAQIVRATQAYHVKSRKWCDLGYNFLVDKYGQIFEGRRGGIDRAIRAAHSGNAEVNTYAMGVSMMGNYDEVKPTPALKDAMVRLIGWRLGTNYLKAKGTYSIGGKTLNMIAGHRDVLSTACPGRYGYAWLSEAGGLRDRVEAYMAGYSSTVKSRYAAIGSATAGPIFIGEAQTSTGSRLRAKYLDLYAKGAAGTGTVFAISGAARDEYDRLGSRTGVLGYPAGEAVAVTGGTRQNFDGGYVLTAAATGRATAYNAAGAVITGSGQAAPAPAAKPAKVGRISVTPGKKSARLRWSGVAGATSYEVCLVATKTNRSCDRVARGVTSPTALMSKLKPTRDTDWYAKVRGVNGSAKGAYSSLKGFNLKSSSSRTKQSSVSSVSTASFASTASSASSVSSASTTPAASDRVTVPASGSITVMGHGYGHGIGMSQYGAQGAARAGVAYAGILATYYPGTTLATRGGSIRVLISQDTSDAVDVRAASGLKFRKTGTSYRKSLPTRIGGRAVKSWRIVRVSSKKTQSTLQYRTSTKYRSYKGIRWTGDGQFEGPSRIGLMLPGGTVAYRGVIRSAVPSKGSTARDTVNVLPVEHYVRGVVAAEMPAGWAPEALKAQAVAARTYGVRSLNPSRYYDICSTTACQVYGGASRETAATDAAVRATKGQYVSYQGAPAMTQFSSSSGGRTSAGSQPYLVAGDDPYDGWAGNPNHAWTISVPASTIQKAYPSIGTLRSLTVTRRTGGGDWGGRVASVTLQGSSRSVTISGNDARWAFGLKSNWFSFGS
ncbi:SpoIID/LytB domain-containing protein [Aeromicrobium endophyticum]|uniref:SpoIID/LytB domain-containing protein n=1 Tax=Aeromicrobium endophyticum TaxID=2292704 RepID=A0A371P4P3_9ACTN|nr:SpoIID/LytB domain-containing protein [Aeromicrobium endophyticum]REK70875.1 SpoIID/LytB domain-containing protein [Aeromicrobium endophyticum]